MSSKQATAIKLSATHKLTRITLDAVRRLGNLWNALNTKELPKTAAIIRIKWTVISMIFAFSGISGSSRSEQLPAVQFIRVPLQQFSWLLSITNWSGYSPRVGYWEEAVSRTTEKGNWGAKFHFRVVIFHGQLPAFITRAVKWHQRVSSWFQLNFSVVMIKLMFLLPMKYKKLDSLQSHATGKAQTKGKIAVLFRTSCQLRERLRVRFIF